jgi:hypothetical protein
MDRRVRAAVVVLFAGHVLAGALATVTIIPFVHRRAVRLTARKCLAATPLSLAEVQAEKDLLRAEFAMTNRRLEMTVEGVKTKASELLREVGMKSAEINRLKAELAGHPNPTASFLHSLSLLKRAS